MYFSRKSDPSDIPSLFFNNIQVDSRDSQKHLGVILDKRLAFDHHLSEKIVKANKGIGLIMRLLKSLSRDTLLTIYKEFVRPHLDYGDIIYDNSGNIHSLRKLNPSNTMQPLLLQATSVEPLGKNCIVNLDWRALPIDVFVGDFVSSTM